MTIVEAILERVNALPKPRQQQVLDFAEFFLQKENDITQACSDIRLAFGKETETEREGN